MGDDWQEEYQTFLAQPTNLKRLWWSLQELFWQLINRGGI